MLRGGTMRWAPKHEAIKRAFVRDGINPATGRKCKLHRCPKCEGLFPAGRMVADHIEPVVEVTGFKDWDTYINRMFVETDGFQAICNTCHLKLTHEQNAERRAIRKQLSQT